MNKHQMLYNLPEPAPWLTFHRNRDEDGTWYSIEVNRYFNIDEQMFSNTDDLQPWAINELILQPMLVNDHFNPNPEEPIIGQDEEEALLKRGYYIEDMGLVWGSDFKGQYRFMNTEDEDEFGVPQFSIAQAWADCLQYDQQLMSTEIDV